MTPYLVISAIGLALKLWLSFPTLAGRKRPPDNIGRILFLFIYSFIAYSVTQVLVFSPVEWNNALGIERLYLMRVHYFLDVVCLVCGVYLLLSYLDYEGHKRPLSKVLICGFIVVGGYMLLFTNAFISSDMSHSLDNTALHLGGGFTGYLINIPRVVMGLSLLGLLVLFYRVYSSATENIKQVKSLYAITACLFYNFNCFIGAFAAYPLIISIRGSIYFIVILLILRKDDLYDLRVKTPTTFESKSLSEFKSLFREYANDALSHKDFMQAVEKNLVSYKLNKASSFNDGPKSELPRAAKSMGVSLSLVYALIDKHDLKNNAKQEE